MWDVGLSGLSRQQREVVAGLALSLLFQLMSQVTIKTSSRSKKHYSPQGGKFFFGGTQSTGVSNIADFGVPTQSPRLKPVGKANGTPLTQSEKSTLRALLQKQRAAQELALVAPAV